jgi:hypothetical protein
LEAEGHGKAKSKKKRKKTKKQRRYHGKQSPLFTSIKRQAQGSVLSPKVEPEKLSWSTASWARTSLVD